MEKRSLKWIELTRTFAMFFIVLCHSSDMVSFREDPWWAAAVSSAVRFAVPLFFIISGYLAGGGLPSGKGKAAFAGTLRHRIAPIIVNFLAWNIIYMFLVKIFFGAPLWSFNSLWSIATGYVHLYFIFVLMQLLLLHRLVSRFLKGSAGNAIITFAAILSIAFYVISDTLLWTRGADGYFFEWHWGKLFAAWSLFYFWGVWLGRRTTLIERMSRAVIPLAAATAVFFVPYAVETHVQLQSYGYSPRGYFLAGGLAFQFLCANLVLASAYRLIALKRTNRLTDAMVGSGADTYGIYLCHYAFVMAMGYLQTYLPIPLPPVLAIPLIAVIAWTASQGLVRVLGLPRFGAVNRVLFRMQRKGLRGENSP